MLSASLRRRYSTQNEPGAEAVHVYVSEADNALYVRDEFADAGAVGFHLQSTAAAHFPQLLAVATPGPFFFMGDVPDEMKQATEQMQLGAQFSTHAAGFDRSAGGDPHSDSLSPHPRTGGLLQAEPTGS